MKSSPSATSEPGAAEALGSSASARASSSVQSSVSVPSSAPDAAGKGAALPRVVALLSGLWAGLLLTISAVATPVPFAVLERAAAGQVVQVVFLIEAYASIVFAIITFVIERGLARRAADTGRGSALSTNMLLVLGALFCTVLGYFALQPMMAQARLGQGTWSFGALHAASTVMFGLKTVLVLALAWRATLSPASRSS